MLFAPILSRELDYLARLSESALDLLAVSLAYVFEWPLARDDRREAVIVPCVDDYKKLLSDPVGPFLLVYVVQYQKWDCFHSLQERFPWMVCLGIETLFDSAESIGPVNQDEIIEVSLNNLGPDYGGGGCFPCSDVTPKKKTTALAFLVVVEVFRDDLVELWSVFEVVDSEFGKLLCNP